MKRLVVIISTFLILAGMYGGNVGAKDHEKDDSGGSKMVWCATKYSVTWIRENYCRQEGGKSFSYKTHAKAEQNRLKNSSSSYSSTASSSSSNLVWCARITGVTYEDRNNCTTSGGDWFVSQGSAETEHDRLKRSSSTASSSGSKQVWCALLSGVSQQTRHLCWASGGTWHTTKQLAQAAHQRLKNNSSSYFTASGSSSNKWWCARITGVTYEDRNNCTTSGGDWFVSQGSAETEHNRLKRFSSTESSSSSSASTTTQTAQTTTSQPTPVDKTAEIEFWKSVKDSGDPDMFREYLRQFPQGVYAGLAKLKVKKLGGDTTSVAKSSIPNLDYGDYYALVIGNNRYEHLQNLRTAVNDARNVADLLKADYGFDVTLLENADRVQILNSISGLRSKVSSEDNVLIYYAGHGWLDEAADEGFWLPVDAKDSVEDQSSWIATDRVVGQIRAMKAKHVMIVADSCFSGTLTRGLKIEQRTPDWLETIVKKKARTALTSGGLEPVSDSGGGENSVFAHSFLSILRDNDGVLDASQLFSQLRPKVMVNSDQTPEYGDIHRAGHDGGDFLFVRQ